MCTFWSQCIVVNKAVKPETETKAEAVPSETNALEFETKSEATKQYGIVGFKVPLDILQVISETIVFSGQMAQPTVSKQ